MTDRDNGLHAGRFRIVKRIGEGASSVVYAAFDNLLECEVALKVLHSHLLGSHSAIERFRNEALLGQQLRHPHIVTVFDIVSVEENGETRWIALVQELIKGLSLTEYLQREPSADRTGIARRILLEISDALEYAHRESVLHRDVKPSNILISEDGIMKLSDFGVAKGISTLTMTTESVPGTVRYMAPELKHGSGASPASDFYALGLVVCDVLLAESDPARPGICAEAGDEKLLSKLPGEFRPVVKELLAEDPRDRLTQLRSVEKLLDRGCIRLLGRSLTTTVSSAARVIQVLLITLLCFIGLGVASSRFRPSVIDGLFAIRAHTGIDIFPIVWFVMSSALDSDEVQIYAAKTNNVRMLDWLRKKGVEANTHSGDGRWPVCVAIEEGAEEAAVKLIEAGAEGFAEITCEKQAPIVAAVRLNRSKVVRALLESRLADPLSFHPISLHSALELALIFGSPETKEILNCATMKKYSDAGWERIVLSRAIDRGDVHSVRNLLGCAEMDLKSNMGLAEKAVTALAGGRAVGPRAVEIFRMLVEQGVLKSGHDAIAALVLEAIKKGDVELLQALVEKRAFSAAWEDQNGNTLDYYLDRTVTNREEMIRLVESLRATEAVERKTGHQVP